MPGKIFLVPNVLAENTHASVFPNTIGDKIKHIKHFAVEDPKSARQLLKYWGLPLQELELYSMHVKKGDVSDIMDILKVCVDGEDIGILSDAGMPAIADPGENIILLGHKKGIEIIPLVGPSSLFLALAASGLNGEKFMFHGYLPKSEGDRIKEIKRLEADSIKFGTTHLFIETPYRNMAVFKDLTQHLQASTRLCLAANISSDTEYIKTKEALQWKKEKPEIDNIPCVFLLGV